MSYATRRFHEVVTTKSSTPNYLEAREKEELRTIDEVSRNLQNHISNESRDSKFYARMSQLLRNVGLFDEAEAMLEISNNEATHEDIDTQIVEILRKHKILEKLEGNNK